MRPSLRPAVLATAALTIAAGAAAQTAAPSWRPTVRVQSEVRSDNNPFLLDTLHKQRLAAPTSADSVNGRFRDMNRATDVIAVPSLQVGLAGPGVGRSEEHTSELQSPCNLVC